MSRSTDLATNLLEPVSKFTCVHGNLTVYLDVEQCCFYRKLFVLNQYIYALDPERSGVIKYTHTTDRETYEIIGHGQEESDHKFTTGYLLKIPARAILEEIGHVRAASYVTDTCDALASPRHMQPEAIALLPPSLAKKAMSTLDAEESAALATRHTYLIQYLNGEARRLVEPMLLESYNII